LSHPRPASNAVPDHELIVRIGRGSYGEVWLARNIFGTLRAVKIIRRDAFANPRPFEREFAGIQHVEPLSRAHEGLVDILQIGRAENDQFFYYVMELADPAPRAEGSAANPQTPYSPRSLSSDLSARGRLSVTECTDLFQSLAITLGHLHRAGLDPRDIKPSNIIFVGGLAKLCDIGLVASADDSLSYVGTEGFIPPEGAGTVAADIYSLGKVLYEAGTGLDRTAFPTLPADAADLETSAGLMELNSIWLKACATAPNDRYQNMDEFAAELALLRAGHSIKRLRLVDGRLRRARQFAGIFAILASLIAIGLLIARRETGIERAGRQQADLLRARAEAAERAARDRLSEARIAQTRAILQSPQIGRRAIALNLLTNRVSARLRVEARSLAAAALSLPDLVPIKAETNVASRKETAVKLRSDGSIVVTPVTGNTRTIPSQGEPLRQTYVVSDDGRYLYASYAEYTERIWDLSDGRLVARLDTNYYRLSFRPAHPQVAVAYVNGDIVVHHLPGWEVDRVWPHAAGEGTMKWNGDGSRLLAVVEVGQIHQILIGNVETGELRKLEGIGPHIETVAWHPDGRRLAIASNDGYVRVKDIESLAEPVLLTRHDAQIIDAVFLPPYPWLVTSSWDGTSKLWDWQAGHELGRLEATGYEMNYDATAHVLHWRLGSEPKSSTWQPVGGAVWREFFNGDPREAGGPFMASFSGDSQWLAAPDNDGIRVWHIESGTEALFLPFYSQAIWINSDATELIGNCNGAVRRWNLSAGANHKLQARETMRLGPAGYEGKLAVSANGSAVAWIHGAEVKLNRNGKTVSWNHRQELAETIAISPNGKLVTIGTRNHHGARIFDSDEGSLLWATEVGNGSHVTFSADNQWLAVGTDNGCYVFSASEGALRWHRPPTHGPDPSFWESAFSPDGTLLAWTPNPSQGSVGGCDEWRRSYDLGLPKPPLYHPACL
jgi:serine/threonine protein kinase/WD40 repeat protein